MRKYVLTNLQHMKMGCLAFSLSVSLVILNLFGVYGRCIERERLALLDFKKSFVSTLPDDRLFSWKSSEEEDCCNWDGISCDNVTGHVVSLHLGLQLLKSNKLQLKLLELQHLESLNLSYNEFSMKIPEFIGSLSKLTHFDVLAAGFYGKIPPHLGNLSSLQSLYLSNNSLSSDSFEWVSKLSALKILYANGVNFSEAKDWLYAVKRLPLLSKFRCSGCSLPLPLSSSTLFDRVNSSTSSLLELYLSGAILNPSSLFVLINSTRKLSTLDLEDVAFEDPFPNIFHNLNSLETLYISGIYIDDRIFKSIGNLSNLRDLYASNSCLNQTFVGVIQALTSFADSSLISLDLSSNNFTGTIPPMLKFPSLETLDLSDNRFESFSPQNSMIPPKAQDSSDILSINDSLQHTPWYFPSYLRELYLSSNSVEGVLTDSYLSNLSHLETLDLSNNPNLTVSFIKPLPQLRSIRLRSCKLGPNFPAWLVTLKSYEELDISNSLISGSIPSLFWKNLPFTLQYLNLSFNNFHDRVSNLHFVFRVEYPITIDLSSNKFYGLIPVSLFQANILHLSKYNFSSIAPIPHSMSFTSFLPNIATPFSSNVLDISDNGLSGKLPDQFWLLLTRLYSLSLANNNLSGSIPSSIGDVSPLYVLILKNNSFSGELPSWLGNCTYLRILDLSENNLSGLIPSWVGENLTNMVLLSLGSNHLSGTLPTSLFHLSSLRIIDLSNNTLSGNIPSSVQYLTAMVHDDDDDDSCLKVWEVDMWLRSLIPLIDAPFYQAFIKWKGMDRLFQKTLQKVKLIDLSSNNLIGEIPEGLTCLLGLNSLDLSNNHFHGSIPQQIGQLKSLEVLNLSNSRLCGEIPSSLSTISALDVLDLSHNNLSGKIPTGTQLQSFAPSAYAGNPKLCGLPLQVKCLGDAPPPVPLPLLDTESNQFDMESFFGAMGFGFAFGFLVALGTLSFVAKWRRAFFGFASEFVDCYGLI